MATPEENKRIVTDYVDATNRLSLDELDQWVVEDYVENEPIPNQKPGLEGLKEAYRIFNTPFPDIHFIFEDVLGEGDLVFGRGVISGTHEKEFMGIPPTGKKVYWTGTRLFRLKDGKITEGWVNIDMLGLLQQLGVVPAPPGTTWPPPKVEPPQVEGGRVTTPEENKAIMRRMIDEVWNKRNLDVADELFHPEASSPSAPTLPRGPEGVKLIARMFHSAFPDYWMRIDHMVADGDRVAAKFTQGGTHQGELFGIPATGKQAEWTETGILRIADGKIVESWYDVDMLGMMQQLGVGGAG